MCTCICECMWRSESKFRSYFWIPATWFWDRTIFIAVTSARGLGLISKQTQDLPALAYCKWWVYTCKQFHGLFIWDWAQVPTLTQQALSFVNWFIAPSICAALCDIEEKTYLPHFILTVRKGFPSHLFYSGREAVSFRSIFVKTKLKSTSFLTPNRFLFKLNIFSELLADLIWAIG